MAYLATCRKVIRRIVSFDTVEVWGPDIFAAQNFVVEEHTLVVAQRNIGGKN
tara:strand:+ start:14029 stop:14184 length:156 start_codon:yes stop_codon:yes gene_type:complete